jgi:hypothetical protein
MANAKKLTEPQIAALRDAAKGDCGFTPRYTAGYGRSTIEALRRRGLLGNYRAAGGYAITPAGRHALFEATGEHGGSASTVMEQFDDADAQAALAEEKIVRAARAEVDAGTANNMTGVALRKFLKPPGGEP